MRRRKHRFPLGVDKTLNNGHQQSGSSDGPSSDFSADTVIYMGPCNDETDGEHPPVFLPSLTSAEDNRCAMNKALKGSIAEKSINKTPTKKINASKRDGNSPISTIQRIAKPATTSTNDTSIPSPYHGSPVKSSSATPPQYNSPQKLLQHKSISNVENKSINVPSPKGSPMKRPTMIPTNSDSPKHRKSEEKWVDGPRVSRAKVAEARHLLREKNHIKQCETWIDGPNTNPVKPLTANTVQGAPLAVGGGGYGFMDNHKKSMIRQWVENQTTQILSTSSQSTTQSPQHRQVLNHELMELKSSRSENDKSMIPCRSSKMFYNSANNSESNAVNESSFIPTRNPDAESEKSSLRSNADAKSTINDVTGALNDEVIDDEDEDSGPSEVPPALPLIDSLSREISHDSIHLVCSRHHQSRESMSIHSASVHSASVHSTSVQMMDCGLQVTEEEINRTMNFMNCHPLSALSNAEMSVVSSFNIGDAFSECGVGDRTR